MYEYRLIVLKIVLPVSVNSYGSLTDKNSQVGHREIGNSPAASPRSNRTHVIDSSSHYSRSLLSRRELYMTETEEKLIAAAAIIGLRSNPSIG